MRLSTATRASKTFKRKLCWLPMVLKTGLCILFGEVESMCGSGLPNYTGTGDKSWGRGNAWE